MANIVNQYGQVKVGVRTQAGGGVTPLLLDTYSGASAAYSLRKLRTAYTGYAIRVRRSSDNTSQDIGFDANGTLDTTTLLSFVGAGNGFVSIWYDQSGNYNLSQNTSSNQPSIVLSGVLNSQNGKPVLITDYYSYMINGSLPINGTTNSIFATIKLNSPRGGYTAMMSSATDDNQHFPSWNSNGTNRYYDSNGQVITAPSLPDGLNLINLHENSSGITVYENGNNLVTNFTHTTGNTTGLTIFRRASSDGNYMRNGQGYSELVIYGSSSKLSDNTGISANINTYYSIYSSDADAQAFITAAGITDTTQKSAINTLVTDLKSANIWTKMKAIYPFVGGTASAHKFNLKDPRDLDAAYRLVFNGGMLHSNLGIVPNGTTSYADTKLNPTGTLTLNSAHISAYINDTGTGVLIGTDQTNRFWISPYYGSGPVRSSIFMNESSYNYFNSSTNKGLWLGSRINSSTAKLYNNSSVYLSSSFPSVALENGRIFIAARATGVSTADIYFNKPISFSSIGDGLTDAEVANFYTAIQAFQTTLGRAV